MTDQLLVPDFEKTLEAFCDSDGIEEFFNIRNAVRQAMRDRDALVAGPHEMKLCLGLFKAIRNTPQNYLMAISTMAIDETIARLEKKLAALPKHLRD